MSQEQPISTTQSEDVTPIARQVFLDTLLEREREGIETYGVSLQTHNGRDAIQDAIEEAVDLWQYLIQIEMERADLERQLEEARQKLQRIQDMCDFIIKDHLPLDMIRQRFEQVQKILRAAEGD